jgi:hypothetical protein
LARPTIDDLIEDTNIRMYNLQPENLTALTESSLKKLKSATSSSLPYLRRLRYTFDL